MSAPPPRRARAWLGRLALLGLAGSLGAMGARALMGPPVGSSWASAVQRDHGLAVSEARWTEDRRRWGVTAGRLWLLATAPEGVHPDVWTASGSAGPGGAPLWYGPPRRVTDTPDGPERLLAATAHRALVQVGLTLRVFEADGTVSRVWRTAGQLAEARLVPEPAARVDGAWRPLDEAAEPVVSAGPPPGRPVARIPAAAIRVADLPAAQWPAVAPWRALPEHPWIQRWEAGGLTVLAFEPRHFTAEYVWGTAGPVGSDGAVGSGQSAAPDAVRVTLTADAVGDAGLRVAGRAVRPLRRGSATLALDPAGRAGFGLWDWEPDEPPWVTVVQRPSPLVVEGRLMPGVPKADAAAALGVGEDGTWLYAVASEPDGVAALGAHLKAAGATLAMTVARRATASLHPDGLGRPSVALAGPETGAAVEGMAGGYLALRERSQRIATPGWHRVAGPAHRPTAAVRQIGAVRVWRLDDDHWQPGAAEAGALWFAHGPNGVPGFDGRRVAGRTAAPMRPRALTLCLAAGARLLRWRDEDASGCPHAQQGLALVVGGAPAAGARGQIGTTEVALGQDPEGRWLVAQSGPTGDRGALAAALVEAGARVAILLGAGGMGAGPSPRWRHGAGWRATDGAESSAPAGAGLAFASRPGRATARALQTFDRTGCDPRRVLLCD